MPDWVINRSFNQIGSMNAGDVLPQLAISGGLRIGRRSALSKQAHRFRFPEDKNCTRVGASSHVLEQFDGALLADSSWEWTEVCFCIAHCVRRRD